MGCVPGLVKIPTASANFNNAWKRLFCAEESLCLNLCAFFRTLHKFTGAARGMTSLKEKINGDHDYGGMHQLRRVRARVPEHRNLCRGRSVGTRRCVESRALK